VYRVLFGLLACICWFLFRVLFRLRIIGLENVPATGAIIAPNHQSIWDIPLIGFILGSRRTHFMAKSELFQNPVFSWLIRNLLAFPVKRGAPDRTAIRYAIEILKQGDLVAIFPEGTRSKNGKLGEAEPGLALIAAKAGVPIVPVGISGSHLIFSKTKWFPCLKVKFGNPILVDQSKNGDKGSFDDVSACVMKSISELIDNKSNDALSDC
jgi:1-acyl-sn-glycerol-3-phosphate acyltransferase